MITLDFFLLPVKDCAIPAHLCYCNISFASIKGNYVSYYYIAAPQRDENGFLPFAVYVVECTLKGCPLAHRREFIRIHKNYFINSHCVLDINSDSGGHKAKVLMCTGQYLSIARTKQAELIKHFIPHGKKSGTLYRLNYT